MIFSQPAALQSSQLLVYSQNTEVAQLRDVLTYFHFTVEPIIDPPLHIQVLKYLCVPPDFRVLRHTLLLAQQKTKRPLFMCREKYHRRDLCHKCDK